MNPLELRTRHLSLFVPAPDKAAAILEYYQRNKEHLRPTDPVLPKDFYTLEFWQRRLKQSAEEFERDQSVRIFFERLEEPGRVIGHLAFSQIARGPFQACYLGYTIDRESQGRGLMFEALTAAIRFMFEKRHIHRIMANHLPENERSANVLKRLGFRVDGSSPDYLHIGGSWRPHILNSLTNPNWTPREEDRDLF